MENPYEENTDYQSEVDSTGLSDQVNIDVTAEIPDISLTPQDETLLAENSAAPSTEKSSTVNLNTREGRRQMWAERKAFRQFEEGSSERLSAQNAWAMKYHGTTWEEYQALQDQRRKPTLAEAFQRNSAFFNRDTQQVMMSPVVGTGDFIADTGSHITKKFGFKITKISKF